MEILTIQFADLTVFQLYDILQLREEVFEIEQACIYPDMDNKDKEAYHLMLYLDHKLVGYARLLNAGISYEDYCSIGRVCTHHSVRRTGFGKLVMDEAILQCQNLFPQLNEIKISAQSYLVKFYSEFGFKSTGKEYLEDDIPHTEMIRQNKKSL